MLTATFLGIHWSIKNSNFLDLSAHVRQMQNKISFNFRFPIDFESTQLLTGLFARLASLYPAETAFLDYIDQKSPRLSSRGIELSVPPLIPI